jgi:hypothetical protein
MLNVIPSIPNLRNSPKGRAKPKLELENLKIKKEIQHKRQTQSFNTQSPPPRGWSEENTINMKLKIAL